MRGNKLIKLVDIFIGIPVVFILGLFRKKRSFTDKEIKKIGVLHTAPIGDTIISAPIVKDLQSKYSQAEIVFFTGKDGFQAAELFMKVKIHRISLNNVFKTIQEIRSFGNFDIWVDFGPWPRINSIISYFVKSDFKTGFKSRMQFRHYTYDKWAEHSNEVHELKNYRNLIKLVNVDSRSIPELHLDVKIVPKSVIVHMFPGGYKSYYKKWGDKNWIEIIKWLLERNYTVFITGAPSDRDDSVSISNVFKENANFNNVIGKCNLKEVAKLIAESQLVISVNTGILHLASSLKKEIIALHGPTSIKRWGPVCDNAVSIKSVLPCSPCLHFGSEYGCKCPKCMNSIAVEQVLRLIQSKIEKKNDSSMLNIVWGDASNC